MKGSLLGIISGIATILVSHPARAQPVPVDPVTHQLVEIIIDPGRTYSLWSRLSAARTLGSMGPVAISAAPDLIRVLNDPYRTFPPQLDEAVVQAMGKMGPAGRDAIPALVRNMGRTRDLDRAIEESVHALVQAAARHSDPVTLVRELGNPDPAIRLKAAKTLGSLRGQASGAVGALTLALDDPDKDVRRMALAALQEIQPEATQTEAAARVYARDLQDPDQVVRLGAAKALGFMGANAASALPALQATARRDGDEDVRRVATEAAAQIMSQLQRQQQQPRPQQPQ